MKHGLKVHLEVTTNSGRLRPQMGEAWIASGDAQARLKRHLVVFAVRPEANLTVVVTS